MDYGQRILYVVLDLLGSLWEMTQYIKHYNYAMSPLQVVYMSIKVYYESVNSMWPSVRRIKSGWPTPLYSSWVNPCNQLLRLGKGIKISLMLVKVWSVSLKLLWYLCILFAHKPSRQFTLLESYESSVIF